MAVPVFDFWGIIRLGIDKAADLAKWVAYRAFIIGAIGTLVPIAIFMGWTEICKFIFDASNTQAGTTGMWTGSIVQYTGLGAWFATQLKMPECMSVLLSAYAVRFALSFLRK